MTVDVVTGELLPVASRTDLLTSAPVNDVVELQRDYLALCNALLDDSDFQDGVKKKSAWRKLAAAFNVSDEIMERHLTYDDNDRIVRAEYVVEAIAPNGRKSVGVGFASKNDRRFSNPEHDIPATAHTRAKNRAFSDLFGMGEVSAEEIDARDNKAGDQAGGSRGRRRANDHEPSGSASSSSATDGDAATMERVNKLGPDARKAFDAKVSESNWPWPPTSPAVIKQANRFLDELEADD